MVFVHRLISFNTLCTYDISLLSEVVEFQATYYASCDLNMTLKTDSPDGSFSKYELAPGVGLDVVVSQPGLGFDPISPQTLLSTHYLPGRCSVYFYRFGKCTCGALYDRNLTSFSIKEYATYHGVYVVS